MEVLLVLDFTVKSLIHNYDVNFVLDASSTLNSCIKDGDVILIDKKIIKLHPTLLRFNNPNISLIEIEAIEDNKSYSGLNSIIHKLISGGFRKNHRLIGIGGGITQDITAFISSILFRGVDWIFFPTTLLAQGDSCIGSKTSINFGEYKNQIGGFYPPKKVFIDSNFLGTLSDADIQSGLGEMAHYFVVAGRNQFKEYKKNYDLISEDSSILTEIIFKSLRIKKKYIEIDEYDQNERQIFNYGHTFGHAIESLTNYKIPHGIAVSFGMDIANFISVKKGYIRNSVRLEIRELLKKIWVSFNISKLNLDNYITALSKDKKNVGDELRLILCKGYGKVFKTPQKIDKQFKGWLQEYFEEQLI
jgi:3-dehydroquinate synthase